MVDSKPDVPIHIPIMVQEVLREMAFQDGDIVVDGTLGLGGHAREIANQIGKNGVLIGMDQDENAIKIAAETLKNVPCKVILIHGRYSEINIHLAKHSISKINRIFLDIGVSSLQIDSNTRGFSFRHDAPLDMRMNLSSCLTAAEWIRTTSEEEMARVFYVYGEERFSRRIAKKIAEIRKKCAIETTIQLAELVRSCIPRSGRIDPATRVFQAIRIVVNDELGELERGLSSGFRILAEFGRIGIITFHSLEDRIVKKQFRLWEDQKAGIRINRKAIFPSIAEQHQNRRSRSAKLRVLEKSVL